MAAGTPTTVTAMDTKPIFRAWEYGLDIDNAEAELSDEFNRVEIPVRSPDSFATVLRDVSKRASSLEQLKGQLREAREAQKKRLLDDNRQIASSLLGDQTCLSMDAALWAASLEALRTKSLESMVKFFKLFIEQRKKTAEPMPQLQSPSNLARSKAPYPAGVDIIATQAPIPLEQLSEAVIGRKRRNAKKLHSVVTSSKSTPPPRRSERLKTLHQRDRKRRKVH